jgi:hypothetical protein
MYDLMSGKPDLLPLRERQEFILDEFPRFRGYLVPDNVVDYERKGCKEMERVGQLIHWSEI